LGEGGGSRDGLNVFDIFIYITNRLLNLIIWFSWKHGKCTRFKLHIAQSIKTNKISWPWRDVDNILLVS